MTLIEGVHAFFKGPCKRIKKPMWMWSEREMYPFWDALRGQLIGRQTWLMARAYRLGYQDGRVAPAGTEEPTDDDCYDRLNDL